MQTKIIELQQEISGYKKSTRNYQISSVLMSSLTSVVTVYVLATRNSFDRDEKFKIAIGLAILMVTTVMTALLGLYSAHKINKAEDALLRNKFKE